MGNHKYLVKPGARVRLKDYDADADGGFKDREKAEAEFAKDVARIGELQDVLYAEDRRALLVVLQAMDTGGKDGVVKHVFAGVNPNGCEITNFKSPSSEELDHDFLWRCARVVPRKGNLGIWNRSHYEDVLIVRVQDLVPKKVWEARYDQINRFEQQLAELGTTVVKFYLHISKDEQKARLQARLDDATKLWKFNPGDLKERERWDDYMAAYEDALGRCSTEWAPWHVVPANRKWFRNWYIARVVRQTLEEMDPHYPEPKVDPKKVKVV